VRIDSRSRGLVAKVTILGLYLLTWFIVFWIVIPFNSTGAITYYLFNAFVFGSGFLAFLALRRRNQRDGELLNYSITGNASAPSQPAAMAQPVREFLARRAHIVQALIMRAGAEINRRDEREGVMRQIHNSRLRELDLWDNLEPNECGLMSSPEGSWTQVQQSELVTWCEQLRLLRWVLGVDAELVPLMHFPQADPALMEGLPDLAALSGNSGGQSSWNMRIEKDIALGYAARVIAELKARNLIVSNSELDEWASQLRDAHLGESSDLLAGAKSVGSLSDSDLMLFARIAITRERYGAYLVDQLAADKPIPHSAWMDARR
jgi:hypothetical protein